MTRIGVDPAAFKLLEGKTIHLNLKLEGVPPRTSNHLKQEMLSLGGDAAVDSRGLDCDAERTEVLLMGTRKQFEQLTLKLEQTRGMENLALTLKETFNHLGKRRFRIRCGDQTLLLGERTLLLGVLNVTPDSFSDGGLFLHKEQAVARGLRMEEEGADLIDIGGESTRPNSEPLAVEEELRRVIPVIEALVHKIRIPLSIDTYKSKVAEEAVKAGARMINDISGLRFDPGLAAVAAREKTPIVLMHIRGTPATMQRNIHYDSLFSEILQSLAESIGMAESAGIDPDQILIDPGIGFGKTVEHNLLLLKYLSELRVLGKPVLLGTSRKSFIGRVTGSEKAEDRLEGTLASIAIGALQGAHMIRCHDVVQARKAVALADAVRNAGDLAMEETENGGKGDRNESLKRIQCGDQRGEFQ
jgi:dihydropteroate synthase